MRPSLVQHEPWKFVYDGLDVSDMADRQNFLLQLNLDTHSPTKNVRTSNLDGKDTSVAVKQASRRKNREYVKHGNSQKYKELKKEVQAELKLACTKIVSKQTELAGSMNNLWMKHVKRITARPRAATSSTFTLPQHVEDNLTALESSNKICEFFSSISQEYSLLNIDTLPAHVRL